MSEEKKRPAHEVILGKLSSAVAMLNNSQWSTAADGLHRVRVLCEVLTEMAIPDEKRREVAGKLLPLVDLEKKLHEDRANEVLQNLHDLLMSEVRSGKE